MYVKVFQMGSFPLNLHQNMSYGKILTCQVFSDRRSPRGESPPGLDQIDRVKLANCGLPSAVQAETSIDIALSYVQHDNQHDHWSPGHAEEDSSDPSSSAEAQLDGVEGGSQLGG